MSQKHNTSNNQTLSWIRCALWFSLLRSAVLAIHGSRKLQSTELSAVYTELRLVAIFLLIRTIVVLFVCFHFNLRCLVITSHHFTLRQTINIAVLHPIQHDRDNKHYIHKICLRLIIAVWLCLLLFIYLHTVNNIIVSIIYIYIYIYICIVTACNTTAQWNCTFSWWHILYFLLLNFYPIEGMPSFTVISCTQLFVLQNSISPCSISCYHFRTHGPAHMYIYIYIYINSYNSF